MVKTRAARASATGQRTTGVVFGNHVNKNNTAAASLELETTVGAAAGDGLELPAGVWASIGGTRLSNNFATTCFDSDLTSFAGGVDWFWGDQLLVGMAFALESQDTKTFANSGRADSTNVSVIPYAGYLINDFLSADLSVGYTRLNIDQIRSIGTLTFDSSTDSERYFVASNLTAFHVQRA